MKDQGMARAVDTLLKKMPLKDEKKAVLSKVYGEGTLKLKEGSKTQ